MSAARLVKLLIEDDFDAKDFVMAHLPDALENALKWACDIIDEGFSNGDIRSHEDASERVPFLAKAGSKMYNLDDEDRLEIERRLFMHVDKVYPDDHPPLHW